ncbi:MAG: glycosyltransferase [bacterium]
MNTKKNILLTTSAAPLQSPFSTVEKRPPLGIGFFISILRNAGHEVFFIDNYLRPSNFLETDYLMRNSIDFVGIYANTICYRDTLRMLYRLEYFRRTGIWTGKIIIGGPHTTVALDTIPDFVDYVVQGEGEQAILDIVEGKVQERIICYPRLKNLDELPIPAWDYFIHQPYNWSVDWFNEKPIFTLNTSRGCPFRCTFCSVGSIWGREYTYFSAERIISDIEYLIKNYGAKGIYFREDNFTLHKNRLREFCHLIIRKGINIAWLCESRVNTLDREMVELMYRAGARGFYFGVESGSQRILDFLKKGITVEHIKNAFKLCHEFGMKTAASIIVGVPTETEEDIIQTVKLLGEIKPTVTWYNVFVGIPNSNLYHYVKENKLYEFIDDRGLVYLKGHNDRVRTYYRNSWDAYIPPNRNNPSISVVMSVFNGGKYLESSLNSVLNQTFQDFECIIINDASIDNTEEILKRFNDPRIKIAANPENLGLTKSLNKGLSLSKGKYIARMDADDISLPHRFEKQLTFLEENPDHALVGSSYYQIDDRGKIGSLIKVLTNDSNIRPGLKNQNWFGHGSVMMRRDAALRLGGYNERYTYAQDYDLWLRMAETYKVANLEEPLYCWRLTSSCISMYKEAEQKYYASLAISEAKEREKKKVIDEKKIVSSSNLPMVSVIVPTYNRPDMLADALKSILDQSYQNFEIIVVNDAGIDVENIVTSLNHEGTITYIKHSRNRGLAAARNTGIKVARGKYIAYLDDDDLFYPDHMKTLITFLDGNDYRIAYTDAHRAHQKKNEGKYITLEKDVPYSFDFDCQKMLRENFIPVLCFMHEKACLDEVGLFDESLKCLEDWDLWIRMSQKFAFAHIKKVTCMFSWRTDGTTMTSGKWEEFEKARSIIAEKFKPYSCEKVSAPTSFACMSMSSGHKDLVSIVILTLNQLEYTKKCEASIRKYTPEPHEIIFIDNNSHDGTVRWLRRLIHENKNYKLIENRENFGFAKGCNQGMAASSGEFVLLLNNDVIVTEGWLAGMLECLKNDPKTGIVGPMTNHISGMQKVMSADYKTREQMQEYARLFREKHRYRRVPQRRVVGFCMLFRRELVEKIGGLDKRFGSGNFEDDDFCLRAELEGYRNCIAGDVFIHHYGSRSFIGNRIDYRSAMAGNRNIFHDKWSGIPQDSIPGRKLIIKNTLEEAGELNQKGEGDKAVERLIEGIRLSPDSEEIYQTLAEVLIEAKRFKDANDALQAMPERAREDIKTLELIGYCKEGLELSQEAKRYADLALSMNPAYAPALNLKGILAYKQGNKKVAESFFKRAIESYPGYGEPHTNLGVIRWAEGNWPEGLELLERGFILSPVVMDIASRYHSAVTKANELARAEVVFREAKMLFPTNQRISYLLIDILLKQEQYKEAMQEIEEAMVVFGVDDGILSAALEVRRKIGPKETNGTRKGKGAISLCMIVKNEEQYMARCLMSVKPAVDEMVVVDTGSTDRTRDIAKAFGAKVYDFAWTDDFSEARNYSLSKVSGDWILILDADEVLSALDHAHLAKLVKKNRPWAYTMVTRNYTKQVNLQGFTINDGKYPHEEAGIGWFPSTKVRLFPQNHNIWFKNPVHESVEETVRETGIPIKPAAIPVHHYGKLQVEKIIAKGEAYYQLGRKKLEENGMNDLKALFELGVQAAELGRFEEAAEIFKKLTGLNQKYPLALFNLGSVYIELGRYHDALITAQKAFELNPEHKECTLNYAHCELVAGNINRAISLLEETLRKSPEYAPAMAMLAAAYCICGRREGGLEIFETLSRKGFDCSASLHGLAHGLYVTGRFKHSISVIEGAVKSRNICENTSQLLKKNYWALVGDEPGDEHGIQGNISHIIPADTLNRPPNSN